MVYTVCDGSLFRFTQWDSEEEFSPMRSKLLRGPRNIAEECYNLEKMMGNLARYFDYDAFARELFMYDYQMGTNNKVFRVI